MNNIFDFPICKLIPLSALALLVLSQSASALTIDNFTTEQGGKCDGSTSALCVFGTQDQLDQNTTQNLTSFVSGTGILTGERDLFILSHKESEGGSSIRVQNNHFKWSNNAQAESSAIIQWDGSDNSNDPKDQNIVRDLNAENDGTFSQDKSADREKIITEKYLSRDGNWDDYTENGQNTGFLFNIIHSQADFKYNLFLTDNDGDTISLAKNSVGTSGSVYIGFNDGGFTLTSNGGSDGKFDFSQVDNFQLTLNSLNEDNDVDFTLGFISTSIPEPSQVLLWATGLLGAGAMSRHKRSLAKK